MKLSQQNTRFLRLFFSLLGSPNWYQGIDKPTLWQWIYKWRIGFRTAYTIAKEIHLVDYNDSHPYENPLEDDHWSDVATRIVVKAAAISALFFSIVWACNRF